MPLDLLFLACSSLKPPVSRGSFPVFLTTAPCSCSVLSPQTYHCLPLWSLPTCDHTPKLQEPLCLLSTSHHSGCKTLSSRNTESAARQTASRKPYADSACCSRTIYSFFPDLFSGKADFLRLYPRPLHLGDLSFPMQGAPIESKA